MPESRTTGPSPIVSIVTVNYKVPAELRALIASVPGAAAGLAFEIIVVDNASGDGSVEMLRRDYPDVITIASPDNLGFSRGNNLGVAQARGEFLVLVNPDVVLPPGSLGQLVDFMRRRPRIGLLGPRIVLPDGTTQSAPRRVPDAWDVVRTLPGVSRAEQAVAALTGSAAPTKPVRCGVVHGSCMLFRSEAYRSSGGLPNHVFMYGEEAIIGHRIQTAGYEVWYNPEIQVWHQDDASANKRWLPHQKLLRKRNGHIMAHAEVLPRPLFVVWSGLMAARELSRAVGNALHDRPSSKYYLNLTRLHLAGITRVKGEEETSLSD